MSTDLSTWEKDYEVYLESYDDDGGKRRKSSKRAFCEWREERMNLVTRGNTRALTPAEKHRMAELEYLMMD
jgi:hypothetical protein